jgi:hypothetical protein
MGAEVDGAMVARVIGTVVVGPAGVAQLARVRVAARTIRRMSGLCEGTTVSM